MGESSPRCARTLVVIGLSTWLAAMAVIVVAGAVNGNLFESDWAVWSLPAWLVPVLGAWTALGKGKCKTAGAEGDPAAETADRAPPRLRGQARRDQRRAARQERRERRKTKRRDS